MTRRWITLAILVSWLGMSGAVHAQCDTPSCLSVGVDGLYWWMGKSTVPALVTRGDINDAVPGAIGQPSTGPVIGPGGLRPSGSPGIRLTIDWANPDCNWGLGGSAFFLSQGSTVKQAGGSGTDPTLAISRPFFNPNVGMQDADPVVVPNVQAGNVSISLPRQFYGAELNLRYGNSAGTEMYDRCTPLLGVRYLHLDEKLSISEHVTDLLDSAGLPGNSTSLLDNFETCNDFFGAQLGVEGAMRFGPVVLTLTGKTAVGMTVKEERIHGATTVQGPAVGTVTDLTRGLLVQPTNSGSVSRTAFGVVPEFEAKLVWELNQYIALDLGYNILYWSNVARPEDQIDSTVNINAVGDPGRLGSSNRPEPSMRSIGFFAHGVHLGFRINF